MRGEAAGNAEADQAAIALPNRGVCNSLQFLAGRTANHLHPRGGGNSRLEVQTYERDNKTTMQFDGGIDDP